MLEKRPDTAAGDHGYGKKCGGCEDQGRSSNPTAPIEQMKQ